jgi:hypothetical protein
LAFSMKMPEPAEKRPGVLWHQAQGASREVSGSSNEVRELIHWPGGNKDKKLPMKEKLGFQLSEAPLEDKIST